MLFRSPSGEKAQDRSVLDELKARKETVWLNGVSEGVETGDKVKEIMEAKTYRVKLAP